MRGGTDQPPIESNPSGDRDTPTARIDQAHQLLPAKSETPLRQTAVVARSTAAGSPADAPTLSTESVERHAAELAEQLLRRQVDLDRRAAALAAQDAEIETKIRNARLWFEQQHSELDARREKLEADQSTGVTQTASPPSDEQSEPLEARQRELDARQAEIYRQVEELTERHSEVDQKLERLAARESQLKEFEHSIDRRQKSIADERDDLGLQLNELDERRAKMHRRNEELEARDAELRSREAQMAFRRQEIETAIARFEQLGVSQERIEMLDAQAAEFDVRSKYLDKAEALLKQDTQGLAAQRQELEDERRGAAEQIRIDRGKLLAEQQTLQQQAARRQQELDQRENELDQREESLVTLRLEMEASQREVLEMRLATEETWAQLTGALAPASLTRSISQTRVRLADHYEQQLSDLCERRDELDQFRTELAEQHVQLETKRTQFAEWQQRREYEIEEQAGRLITREQELDRQQMHYEAQESKWRLERDDYRAEIRDLLTQLRQGILESAA